MSAITEGIIEETAIAKFSTALTFTQNRYSFPMEIAHFDRLRRVAGYDAPNYLVVFQMPADENEWVHYTTRSREQWIDYDANGNPHAEHA